MFLDQTASGGVHFPFGDDLAVLHTLPETCSLDVAGREQLTQSELGALYGVSQPRITKREQAILSNLFKRFS